MEGQALLSDLQSVLNVQFWERGPFSTGHFPRKADPVAEGTTSPPSSSSRRAQSHGTFLPQFQDLSEGFGSADSNQWLFTNWKGIARGRWVPESIPCLRRAGCKTGFVLLERLGIRLCTVRFQEHSVSTAFP